MLCLRSKEWKNYSPSVWSTKREESSSLPLCYKTKVKSPWALFLKVLKSKDRLLSKSVRLSEWTRLIFLEVLLSLIKTRERLRDSMERILFRSEISTLKKITNLWLLIDNLSISWLQRISIFWLNSIVLIGLIIIRPRRVKDKLDMFSMIKFFLSNSSLMP
jgi:hypothetical protein